MQAKLQFPTKNEGSTAPAGSDPGKASEVAAYPGGSGGDGTLMAKLNFQARGQFTSILQPFNCHGLQDFIEPAIKECLEVCQRYAMNVVGQEVPMNVVNGMKARATE